MSQEKNKRIAKNTLILYFRMIVTMLVSLYTSRIVLKTLGVEDFGIYNVVGGIVVMLGFLNQTMAASTQRFLSFEIGRDNFDQLKKVFSVSISIHFLIAFIIFLLAETIGLWFLNTHMNIAANRIEASNWVYQCSILAFMVSIVSVPYNALIIAHERMRAFAYVSILEVSLKLLIVFILTWVSFDKLKLYALLILAVYILIRIVYGTYCTKHFPESKFKFLFDKKLYKEILTFAGWNVIGASSAVAKEEGVNILLNIFCGAVVNASRGISYQVKSAIQGFVSNFQLALFPQITMSYASGNKDYLISLIQRGAKYSYFLLFFLSLPVLIDTETVLRIWLTIVPDYVVIFVRLALISAMIESLYGPFTTAMLATGNIRNYEIVLGGLQLLNLPLSYVSLKLGYPPQATLVIAISISVISMYFYLWFLKRRIQFPVRSFLVNIILKILLVSICSLILPILLFNLLDPGIVRLFLICVVSSISTVLGIYVIGLSTTERELIKGTVMSKLIQIKSNNQKS